jgi:hypothetical protein
LRYLGSRQGRSRSAEDNRQLFARTLVATVDVLRNMGKKVLIIGPIPELAWPAPARLAAAALWGAAIPSGPTLEQFQARQSHVLPVLDALAKRGGVAVVYPHKVLCDAVVCAVEHDGKRLYFDDNHIDAEGNRLLEPLVRAGLERVMTFPAAASVDVQRP